MKVFDHPNVSGGWKCPICHTAHDIPIVLIGIFGTEDGDTVQAEQFHLECLDLRWHKDSGFVGMVIET